MEFKELLIFKKELKKLKKKYKSLDEDLEVFKRAVKVNPAGNGSKHWNILHSKEKITVFKVRLSCTYLKKKSFRLIYAYHEDNNTIEFIQFIEIYFKGDKLNEDNQRIKEYLKNKKL